MARAINPAYANKGDLTQGSVTRHLVRLTLPMAWGIFAIISFQLVDTFYIAMLGTQHLAAISFTFPVTYTVHSLIIGMSIATSSVISRQIGARNWPRVRRLTTHALMLAFLLGLLVAVIGLTLIDPLFHALGAPPEMLPLIRDYMVIWFAGSLFVNTPMVGNAAIRATGDTFLPAVIMTVVAIVNIILDPILIFGLFGFPRLEMRGAALATVFANGCALLAGMYVIGIRNQMLSKSKRHLRLFRDSARRFLYIALPAGLMTTIQPVTNAIIVALLAGYGAEAVAAYGIVTRVEAFAFVIIMALATGMAPLIGQNWGARRYERVNEILRKVFLFAVLWSIAVAVVLCLFARPIAGLFSDESGVVAIAALYFWIVVTSAIAGNVVHGWASAFNAMGMPNRSFMMVFVKLVVLTIPLAWLGARFFGITGIFAAIALTNVITGVAFHLWNRAYCRDVGKS